MDNSVRWFSDKSNLQYSVEDFFGLWKMFCNISMFTPLYAERKSLSNVQAAKKFSYKCFLFKPVHSSAFDLFDSLFKT